MPSIRSIALVASLIASAFLMAVAIALPHGSWIAWIGLLPLFATVRSAAPRQATLCGALWGACLYTFLVIITPGLRYTVDAALLSATIPAAYVWVATRFTRRFGFSPLFLGLGWIAVELALRPLGLRNGLLAGAVGHGLLFNWSTAALGSGFVAFIVAASNAALLLAVDNVRLKYGGQPFGVTAQLHERVRPLTQGYRAFCEVRPCRPRAPPAR